MAHRNIETDPLRNFKFRVSIMHEVPIYGSLSEMGFMSASGLAASTEVISYREGGDNTTPRKMPGQTDFPPVSFTRGLVTGIGKDASKHDIHRLWQWYREIFFVTQGGGLGFPGSDFRSEVYIRLYDHPITKNNGTGVNGTARVSWKLYNAWPSALAFSDLDAGGNGVMVNNLTLMYEGFDIRYAPQGNNSLAGAW